MVEPAAGCSTGRKEERRQGNSDQLCEAQEARESRGDEAVVEMTTQANMESPGLPIGIIIPHCSNENGNGEGGQMAIGMPVVPPNIHVSLLWLHQKQLMNFWLLVSTIAAIVLFFLSWLSEPGPLLGIIGSVFYNTSGCRCNHSIERHHVVTVRIISILSMVMDFVTGPIAFVAFGLALWGGYQMKDGIALFATGMVVLCHGVLTALVAKRMAIVARLYI